MAITALIDRDFTPMSGEADSNTWTAIVGAGSGIVGLLAGVIFKSGALRAEVTALALRVATVENNGSKISEKLEKTATKEDMRDGFTDVKQQVRDAEAKQQVRDADIKDQVNALTKAVYDNRIVYRPPTNPIG